MPQIRIALLCLALFAAMCAGEPPAVLLKLDDLTGVHPRFQKVDDFLAGEGLKVSYGIIGEALEKPDPAFDAWVRERQASGRVQFWNHGFSTRFTKDPAKGVTGEFVGTGLEAQAKDILRTQELAKARFGFAFTAWGPHDSKTDDDTWKALAQAPEITAVWFYRPRDPKAFAGTLIARRMELEKPLGNPDPAQLAAAYATDAGRFDYIALQGHPKQWDDARFAAFQEAVRFLKGKGCRFITASELKPR